MEAPNILHQVMSTHSLGQILTCSNQQQQQQQKQQQREATPPHLQEIKRQRPQPEQALRCPRCDSTNTKFCYYNNYSLSQPRYFCKGCRRYWTQGGTLRNVPVGGGCRKNKRSISTKRSLSLSSSSSSSAQDQSPFLPHVPYSLKGTAPPSTDQEAFLQIPSLSPSFLDILRGGSLDCYYQGLYSGLDMGVDCSVGGFLPFGGVGSGETGAAVKQESCRGVEGEGKGVGLQWQVGGGGGGEGMPVVDLWSSSVGSNWHGLINSTLM